MQPTNQWARASELEQGSDTRGAYSDVHAMPSGRLRRLRLGRSLLLGWLLGGGLVGGAGLRARRRRRAAGAGGRRGARGCRAISGGCGPGGLGQHGQDRVGREHLELRRDGALVLEEAARAASFERESQHVVTSGCRARHLDTSSATSRAGERERSQCVYPATITRPLSDDQRRA